jgi:hypothetical protein
MHYRASRTIAAPPERIWSILTDGSRYTEWDPSMERLEGTIAPGEKLKVYTKLSPGRAFPIKVTGFEPNRRMEWSGGMPLGLFKGVRAFTLTPKGDGTTEFVTEEEYTGPFASMILKRMPDLTESFEGFAEGLKQRAESSG